MNSDDGSIPILSKPLMLTSPAQCDGIPIFGCSSNRITGIFLFDIFSAKIRPAGPPPATSTSKS